jgi:hypothetical protein
MAFFPHFNQRSIATNQFVISQPAPVVPSQQPRFVHPARRTMTQPEEEQPQGGGEQRKGLVEQTKDVMHVIGRKTSNTIKDIHNSETYHVLERKTVNTIKDIKNSETYQTIEHKTKDAVAVSAGRHTLALSSCIPMVGLPDGL